MNSWIGNHAIEIRTLKSQPPPFGFRDRQSRLALKQGRLKLQQPSHRDRSGGTGLLGTLEQLLIQSQSCDQIANLSLKRFDLR